MSVPPAWEPWLALLTTQFALAWADPWQRGALVAGAAGAALGVASGLSRTIVPLRWLLVGSNMALAMYGLLKPAPLVLLLHATLLPINAWRAVQMHRLTHRVQRARLADPLASVALQPFMRSRRLASGETLFSRGDVAERLYVLAAGRLLLVEAGRHIEAGEMFGEISFFSPDKRRTASVRCVSPSTVLSIDETTFLQLFHQDPAFGFEIVRSIAARLSADVERLQRALDSALTSAQVERTRS